MSITEIARKVAIHSKASGIDDFGCLYDDDWGLTDLEWDLVCAEAERLLPTVTAPKSLYARYSAAAIAVNAEIRADARLGCYE